MVEALGSKLRRQRRRLGLTLDELAGRTGISKPYLSLIETGRVPNPPSDEKLKRLEQSLGFPSGELLTQAHLHRTPKDVRAMLARLLEGRQGAVSGFGVRGSEGEESDTSRHPSPDTRIPINLDDAYLSGALHQFVESSSSNVDRVGTNPVPVINRVSAGYPQDFTDMNYPKGIADEYVGCPDLQGDKDAFAARVHGDSMTPKYRQGDIVIFSPAAEPKSGDDCFVRFEDGHTTFKRVFFESDPGGKPLLRLQPRNEKYRPQVIASTDVSGLYKALFRYERVDED
ncbi:MAG TPA: LexA family transcriptional regulator [Tepidisphaeraceae bacterium]|nr:LexA family transcriptional regulator [Tepidisphaeraceae bacterium]